MGDDEPVPRQSCNFSSELERNLSARRRRLDYARDMENVAGHSRVSLVVGTFGRTDPIMRLLRSLDAQTIVPLEFILVDQNEPPLNHDLLNGEGHRFDLIHLHHPGRCGISKARNIGLSVARGEWIGFPDDDCWYPKDYLQKALVGLDCSKSDFFTGRPTAVDGRTINGRFSGQRHRIDRNNVFVSQIEWNMVGRRSAIVALGGYDEQISLGGATPWQGGEGFDLLIRAVDKGYRCTYDPELVAHHDEHGTLNPDAAMRKKARRYGRGLGRVLSKHRYGLTAQLHWCGRSFANLLVSLAQSKGDRAAYFAQQFIGRVEGAGNFTIGKLDKGLGMPARGVREIARIKSRHTS